MQIGSPGNAYGPAQVMSRPTAGRSITPVPRPPRPDTSRIQQLAQAVRRLPPSPGYLPDMLGPGPPDRVATSPLMREPDAPPVLAPEDMPHVGNSVLARIFQAASGRQLSTPIKRSALPTPTHLHQVTMGEAARRAAVLGHMRAQVATATPHLTGYPGFLEGAESLPGQQDPLDPGMMLARARLAGMGM